MAGTRYKRALRPTGPAQAVPGADRAVETDVGAGRAALLENSHFRETRFYFDHAAAPARAVHARGFGAHGYFETYEPLTDVTSADLFQRAGEVTPAFVRFSSLLGNRESFDLARDVRGFAVKLYTRHGNWHIVGNNMPVFLTYDPKKFADFVHARTAAPDVGLPQRARTAHDSFWEFVAQAPESLHMAMWLMSDRGVPRAYRFMEGFGVHTFALVNTAGRSTFAKLHWKPTLGVQSVLWQEAIKINGADPDFHRRDLWEAIDGGSFPEWELGLQLLDAKTAAELPFDVLDPTKLVPEELVPVRRVGRLVLDRNVEDVFEETEQVAFGTHHLVPGIDFSDDPVLQGRNSAYRDSQAQRFGGRGLAHVPLSAAQRSLRLSRKDGAAEIHPAPVPDARAKSFADHYNQARQFFFSQTSRERQRIRTAFVLELRGIESSAIHARVVAHLRNIDDELAVGVAEALQLAELPPPAPRSVPPRSDRPDYPSLSVMRSAPHTFAGRKLGVLVTDGADPDLVRHLVREFNEAGAAVELIATAVGGVETDGGGRLEVGAALARAPSVLFDAIALVVSRRASTSIASDALAVAFAADAFTFCKFIAYTGDARPLLERALNGAALDGGCQRVETPVAAAVFAALCGQLRFWARESVEGL